MVTAGDNTCQVTSLPEDVNTAAIEDNGEEVANKTQNVTITKEEETILYELKMSEGELSEEEKGNMTETMKEACKSKEVEKVTIKSTSKDSFNRMANGEVVAVPIGISRRRRAGCANINVKTYFHII